MITLRDATPVDLALLRGWDEREHVIAGHTDADWGWEVELARSPDWREQLIIETDGVPIGFVQIIDPAREDSHYWGEVGPDLRAIDIWIGAPEHRGRGFGAEMMRLALESCFADARVTGIVIDPLASNERAHRFYRRMGFKPIGRRKFGRDDCLIHELTRRDWLAHRST